MKVLRKARRFRALALAAAALAVVLHAALFSLHLTAAFERSLSAQGESGLSAILHAMCGPGAAASNDSAGTPGEDRDGPVCPACAMGASLGCLPAPEGLAFDIAFEARPLTFVSAGEQPRQAFAHRTQRIRGPPQLT